MSERACFGAYMLGCSEQVDRVIQACRIMNVEFVVAPFEADAQLAFMCRTGYVTSVVTEDSDLLAYGCPRVVFKMDKAGAGQEIDISEIADLKIEGEWSTKTNDAFVGDNNNDNSWTGELARLKKFNQEMFTSMCVLSGCDYTSDGIRGLGIKTAFQLVSRYRSLSGVLKNLKLDPKWGSKIPKGDEYTRISQDYKNAEAVFLRHIVYDVRRTSLTKMSESFECPPLVDIVVPEEKLVGEFREQFDAVATGKLHPVTCAPRDQKITELDTMVIESFQRSLSRKIKSAQAIEQSRRAVELNKRMSQTGGGGGDQQSSSTSLRGSTARNENNGVSSAKRNASWRPESEPCAVRRPPEVTPKLKEVKSLWPEDNSSIKSGGRRNCPNTPEKFGNPKLASGAKKEPQDNHVMHGKEESFLTAFECPKGGIEGMEDDRLIVRHIASAGAAATSSNSFHSTLDELKFGRERPKTECPEKMEVGDSFRFSKSFSKKPTAGRLPSRKALPPSAFRAAA
eukprot:GHVS01027195.1.p1 GENE.GHVS01027195.1~~GHVS01027195.1.p1  ORF type:complete len:510 (+),score=67.33 GHVS01027195.1:736-2265(+)